MSEEEDEEEEEIYNDRPNTHESASFSATTDHSGRLTKRRGKNQVSAGGLFRVQMDNLEEVACFLKVNVRSIGSLIVETIS
jgi:hypothetical protein